MFGVESLLALVEQMSGTPYVVGGSSPAGTDCSGLVSMVANAASGRPAFGDRFHTANEEGALLERGFQYGTAPDALVVGWNSGHTAATLPDGTPVAAGEDGGGVKIGGGGAYQPQFTNHMFLPMPPEQAGPGLLDMPPPMPPPPPEGGVQEVGFVFDDPPPPPAPPPLVPGFAPPPPEGEIQPVGFVFDAPPPPPAPEPLPFGFPPPPPPEPGPADEEPVTS